jgi:DNA-binding NarL/FixJ family response regulator
MIKVILVDDHKIVLDSLSLLLGSIDNIEVVEVFENPNLVLPFLENHEVDIVITDCNMPIMSGIDLTYKIRTAHSSLKILLLTMAEDATHIRDAIKAGVHGYILKKTGKGELEKAITKILDGKKYYSEAVIDELAATTGEDLNDSQPETIEHLTVREIEILKLISHEKSTAEIAESLFISISTVETHRANLMKKLAVKSSIGMVKFAIKHQIV